MGCLDLFSNPPDGNPPSRAELEEAISLQKKIVGEPGHIVGVFYIRAKVNAEQLPKIASDPLCSWRM